MRADLDPAWLDALPDAVLVVDSAGRILRANQRCQDLFGWAPEELLGELVETLVPERFGAHGSEREGYVRDPALRPMGAGRQLVARHRSGAEVAVDIALKPVVLDGSSCVVASVRDARAHADVVERLRVKSVALAAAASGIVITDRQGVITWVNAAASGMTGYAEDELVGRNPSLLKSGRHDQAFYAELWDTVLAGRTWRGAIVNRRKDGTLYHEEQTIAPVAGPSGEITHFIAIKQDVTERMRADQALRDTRDELQRRVAEVEALHAKLREQAIHDPLTGLFNRRYVDETLPRELASARRHQTPVTLAVIDLDHFKQVNDRHGHASGDRVLAEFGQLLRAGSRRGDVACRYGGEEFVVLLVGAALGDAVRRVDAWREAFRSLKVSIGETFVSATLSAGLAEWVRDEEPEALFARADAALYLAKAAGRNRVVTAPGPDDGPPAGLAP